MWQRSVKLLKQSEGFRGDAHEQTRMQEREGGEKDREPSELAGELSFSHSTPDSFRRRSRPTATDSIRLSLFQLIALETTN